MNPGVLVLNLPLAVSTHPSPCSLLLDFIYFPNAHIGDGRCIDLYTAEQQQQRRRRQQQQQQQLRRKQQHNDDDDFDDFDDDDDER